MQRIVEVSCTWCFVIRRAFVFCMERTIYFYELSTHSNMFIACWWWYTDCVSIVASSHSSQWSLVHKLVKTSMSGLSENMLFHNFNFHELNIFSELKKCLLWERVELWNKILPSVLCIGVFLCIVNILIIILLDNIYSIFTWNSKQIASEFQEDLVIYGFLN